MAASTALPSYRGNDADQLFICPYDPVHRISAKRFPYHLMKCRKQHSSSTDWARCPFNARHEIPRPELEYHIATCADRDYIRQDYEHAIKADEEMAYKRSIQPQPTVPVQPEETEDWDAEADNTGFTLAGGFTEVENIDQETDRFDILETMHEVRSKVHQEPKRAPDLASMTAAQRKNYKRSLKRQEQRNVAAIASGEIEEEQPPLTDDERLAIIIRQYPLMNSRESGSFVDFVSILNQYCQKNRINPPTYREGPGVSGGFGAECIVMTDIFRTKKYCKTKKEARQNAAMVALLGLNVSVGPDPTPCKPLASRTATEREQIRQTHESQLLGPGMTVRPQQLIQSGPPVTTRPEMTKNNEQGIVGAMGRLNIQNQGSPSPDKEGWTTVQKKAANPVFQHSLKMAGRGRGMPRK